MAYDKILGGKKINTNIKTIRRRGDELNLLVHETFVLVGIHSQETQDCSGADRLLNALGAGLVKSAPYMIETLMKHTPIQIAKKNGQYAATLAPEGSKNFKAYDIDGLRANPWWTMEGANDRPPVIWDVNDVANRLMGVAKQLRKKIEEGEIVDSHKGELEMLARNIDAFAKVQVPSVMGELAPKEQTEHLPIVQPETPLVEQGAGDVELKAVNG